MISFAGLFTLPAHAAEAAEDKLRVEFERARLVDSKILVRAFEVVSTNPLNSTSISNLLYQQADGQWWLRIVVLNMERRTILSKQSMLDPSTLENLDLSSHPNESPRNSLRPDGGFTYRYFESGTWNQVARPEPLSSQGVTGKESILGFFRRKEIERLRETERN